MTEMNGKKVNIKQVKMAHTETGRSMVEMLGVLAVMGVLSIGGVAGYRYAIDKMNANDIINEVRKRAITASQQRILGQNINLSEYGDNGRIKGRYRVEVAEAYNGDSGFFTLTVMDVEKNICETIMKEKIPFETDAWVDIDSDECFSETNDITFAFVNTLNGEADLACAGIECQVGTCLNGSCLCQTTGQEACGTTCCKETEMCQDGTGTCVIVSIGCVNNSDCQNIGTCGEDGCYCQISASNCSGGNAKGTCTPKGTLPKGMIVADLGTVYKGPSGTWWSARNWCLAHGKKLVDIDGNRLKCYRENNGTTPFNNTTQGFCCAKDQKGCSTDKTKQSSIMQKLQTMLNNNESLWTSSSYNSCYAISIIQTTGKVDHYRARHYGGHYALCE